MNAKVTIVRVYADDNGESHFDEVGVDLTDFDYAPPAPSLWVSDSLPASGYHFLKSKPAWYDEWHSIPHRMLMTVLQGELEVEVSDGTSRRLRPGDTMLGEDTRGKGHRSRAVGADGYLAVVVDLAD